MYRQILPALGLLLLFSLPALAGNIFIEEGDLYTGIDVMNFSGDFEKLANEKVIMGEVTDVAQFEKLGFGVHVKPGQKLRLMNQGNGTWRIADDVTNEVFGSIIVTKLTAKRIFAGNAMK